MSNKVEVFRSVLNEFETEELRLFCEDLLEQQLDMNFTMMSSTSAKYHNKTQCQPGGQAYHVLMVGTVMNYILGLEYIQNKFKPKQRDCMRIAALCHDICKTNGGQYTVHEHPILSGEYVEKTPVEHDIDIRLKQYINRLCQSHSGQWTESKKSSVILPKPESDDQFIVHLADYLASRANIDMIYTDEQKNLIASFQEPIDPLKVIIPFGKHSGKELGTVPIDYIKWLSTTELREPLRTAVQSILNKE